MTSATERLRIAIGPLSRIRATVQTIDLRVVLDTFDTLTAERDALKAAKWDVKHVDTANDMVAMGMARDDAIAERDAAVKRAEEAEASIAAHRDLRKNAALNAGAADRRAIAAEERVRVLEEALRSIQYEAERASGGWVHLKRVIGLQAKAALSMKEVGDE